VELLRRSAANEHVRGANGRFGVLADGSLEAVCALLRTVRFLVSALLGLDAPGAGAVPQLVVGLAQLGARGAKIRGEHEPKNGHGSRSSNVLDCRRCGYVVLRDTLGSPSIS